jgi:hypothetical protein
VYDILWPVFVLRSCLEFSLALILQLLHFRQSDQFICCLLGRAVTTSYYREGQFVFLHNYSRYPTFLCSLDHPFNLFLHKPPSRSFTQHTNSLQSSTNINMTSHNTMMTPSYYSRTMENSRMDPYGRGQLDYNIGYNRSNPRSDPMARHSHTHPAARSPTHQSSAQNGTSGGAPRRRIPVAVSPRCLF